MEIADCLEYKYYCPVGNHPTVKKPMTGLLMSLQSIEKTI